jgi:hypothetical protein
MAVALVAIGGVPASAGGDASNTCAGAGALPAGPWHYETLSSASDRDWFVFTRPNSKWALITLGGLGANYRLDLYGACGAPIASSNRSGTQYEELYRRLPAGTYHLRVTSAVGAVSGEPYGLRLRPLATGVQVLSSSGWLEYGSNARIAGEVLNNTSTAREDVRLRIRFYDVSNALLATRFTFARRERLPERARSMFLWSDETIARFDHYTVAVVDTPAASAPPFTGLDVAEGGSTPDGFGGLTYEGMLKNPMSHEVGVPRVMLTIYDAYGRVRNAGFNDTAPDPMAAHSQNPYSIYLSDRNTGNRVVFTAHGYPQ